jgi:DNA adenine methylase
MELKSITLPSPNTYISRSRAGTNIQTCDVQVVKPFLKWAGGKTQLLDAFESRFPHELINHRLSRYVEPFVGGGAVFFAINKKFGFETAHICDSNEELVLAYRVVKTNVDALIDTLRLLETRFFETAPEERSTLFYSIRMDFNNLKEKTDFTHYNSSWIQRTAELIFLNHTCFNGLFRVNSLGWFNVPFGRYKNPRILDERTLYEASATLQNTEISTGDFTTCEKFVNSDTFVYLDPPYRPLNRTSKFTGYSKTGFSDADQVRLAEFFKIIDQRGAKVMLSNSDPKNEDPDDSFFDSLYSGYQVDRVPAKRAINCNGERRGDISELIITNYRTDLSPSG